MVKIEVIDTPLAESNIVGTAIGAAMVGKDQLQKFNLQILFYLQQIKLLVKLRKCVIVQIMIGNAH